MHFWMFLIGVGLALAIVAYLTMYAVRKVEEKPEGSPPDVN